MPEGEDLLIHNVFVKKQVSLDAVIEAFGGDVKQVSLGFAPTEEAGWSVSELYEEDTTFFVKGKAFEQFAERKLRIPSLAHA